MPPRLLECLKVLLPCCVLAVHIGGSEKQRVNSVAAVQSAALSDGTAATSARHVLRFAGSLRGATRLPPLHTALKQGNLLPGRSEDTQSQFHLDLNSIFELGGSATDQIDSSRLW